jgi:hypothetical protein
MNGKDQWVVGARVPLSHHLLSAVVLLIPAILLVSAIAAHRHHTPEAEAAAVDTLRRVASNTSEAMDKYMLRVLNQVLTLARVPAVRKQVEDSNAVPFNEAAAKRLDADWEALKGPPPSLERLLATEDARFLRDLACPPEAQCALLGLDEVGSVATPRLANRAGVLREVAVADKFGRLVLASNATSDYLQTGEDWFENVLRHGDQCAKHVSIECIHTGRAERDESAQSYGFDFAVPIQSESGATHGVLNALVDLDDIVAVLQAIQPPGIQAALVDSSGDAIHVEQQERIAFAKAWVQEQLKGGASVSEGTHEARLHVLTDADAPGSGRDDRRVLAVLSANHLRVQHDWWILVWQSRAAALAPVSQQIWTTVTIVTIALLAAVAVAIQLRPGRPGEAGTHAPTEPLEHREEGSDAIPR